MDEKVINIPEYPDCEMESVRDCDKYEEYSVQGKNLNLSTNNIKYDIGENDWEEDITKTIIQGSSKISF